MATGIDTRTELVQALNEAAELEHGLLCQYLFAAFSVRPSTELAIPRQAERVREWKGLLLWVAVEEMAHLGTVCNLQSAIGAPPHFGRPAYPQPSRYYPELMGDTVHFVNFTLEAFTPATLDRFIRFEAPESPPREARLARPDDLLYRTVGDLYGQIRAAFLAMPESELFIGPPQSQEGHDWGSFLRLGVVRDRAGAAAAIDSIVLDGEGAAGDRRGSHYDTFLNIREQWQQELADDPSFLPYRDVLSNPQLPDPRIPAGPRTMTHPSAVRLGDLFNDVYTTALLMLTRHFSFAPLNVERRKLERNAIRQLMSGALRPLGDMLTALPARIGKDPYAGPTFEIQSPPVLHPDANVARRAIVSRVKDTAVRAGALRAETPDVPRLKTLHECLHTMADTLARSGEE